MGNAIDVPERIGRSTGDLACSVPGDTHLRSLTCCMYPPTYFSSQAVRLS